MKVRVLVSIVFAVLLSGCVGLPDSEGWRYGQKKEFLSVLKTDKYMSICNQQKLYQKVKSSKNSKLMTKLLVAYTYNLANSCINLKRFNASQRAKKAKDIDTYFATNYEKIDAKSIVTKIKAGESIKNILKPYVPQTPQFKKLIKAYKVLKKSPKMTASKLKKIRLNIERTKLMKGDIGKNYVLVNVPEFQLRVIEKNKMALKSRVIVGKTNMQTPIFSERMQYVQINPQWNVPDSIMRRSYIPKIEANPGWVKAQGMELHKETYSLHSKKVNPALVDWSKYPKEGKGYIPYKLVQIPSLKNGLGRMKFVFPNRHAVYIHDTQSKSLFKKSVRAFSHGCVRLSKPKTLLKLVTDNYSTKNKKTVQAWYESGKTKHLRLNKPLQVHTVYYTAYVDEKGALTFFNDIYGFDKSQRFTF